MICTVKKTIRQAIREAYLSQKDKGGLNQVSIAKRIGVTSQTVSMYLSGEREMNETAILSMCSALNIRWQDLGVSIDIPADPPAIAGIKRQADTLRDAPEPLITLAETVISGITKAAKQMQSIIPTPEIQPVPEAPPETPEVHANLVPFDQNYDELRDVEEVLVPMWDYVAAGLPDDSESGFIGFFPVVHSYKKPGWKVVRIQGNSMEPDFMDGDFLLVDTHREAKRGDLVIAVIEGHGGTFKEFGGLNRKTGMISLHPINKDHPDIVLPASQVKISAVYVETTRAKRGK